MRDIRNDLQERIAALDGAHAEELMTYQVERNRLDDAHNATLDRIKAERAALKHLLAIENNRAEAAPHAFASGVAPTVPLVDFLIAKVRTAGPLEKDELRLAAEEAGYPDGRTLHTTLMNITKGGRLCLLSDGRYTAPSLEAPLFNVREADMRSAN